jgi:hypothetical protein
MQTQYTNQKKMQYFRALRLFRQQVLTGARSSTSMRGARSFNSCRGHGGACNSAKASGLGFYLLQYFIDFIQRLMCRADTSLLMNKARAMKDYLIKTMGCKEDALPKLTGPAGRKWFERWRNKYSIVKKVTGMKLKVPWIRVKSRIKTLLGNIFRLRHLWKLCFGERPMRFLSLDQKPSWFNNAGLTGTYARKGGGAPSVREDHQGTRERYTIFTAVQSWANYDESDESVPPKIAVLFKARPDGSVVRRLRDTERKPWMKVQGQDHGSYRSQDVGLCFL